MNIRDNFKPIYDSCYLDEYNRLALLGSVGIFLISYIFWYRLSSTESFQYFYSPYSYYPLEMYTMVFVLHLIIIVNSYKLDKSISHLLSSSLVFFSILLLILEAYYWFSLWKPGNIKDYLRFCLVSFLGCWFYFLSCCRSTILPYSQLSYYFLLPFGW